MHESHERGTIADASVLLATETENIKAEGNVSSIISMQKGQHGTFRNGFKDIVARKREERAPMLNKIMRYFYRWKIATALSQL